MERWLLLHETQAKLQNLQRRLRLKPGKLVRTEARSLGRMARQLIPPPPQGNEVDPPLPLHLRPTPWMRSGLHGIFRVLDTGKGWAYRVRIPSYDRELLDDVRRLLDVGSISRERKPAGPYYRLELADRAQVSEILEKLLPYLRTKRVLVEEWLRNQSQGIA